MSVTSLTNLKKWKTSALLNLPIDWTKKNKKPQDWDGNKKS